jgi:acetoacetyl-CoA synthetase
MTDRPLWTPAPESIPALPISAFTAEARARSGRPLPGYDALHAWSIEDPGAFWGLVWDFCEVIGQKGGRLAEGSGIRGTRFFPDARLNFAENLLRKTGPATAIRFRGEDKVEREMSWDELRALVSRLQRAMRAAGVGIGDRVAAMLPNLPESAAIMLAAASLGATFSSCSPDFGERGVLDRFGQISPKLLFACDGYWYNGKAIEVAPKLAAIAAQLPSAEKIVVVTYLGKADKAAASTPRGETLAAFLLADVAAAPLAFVPLPFDHPLYILFSSGTTGAPKCIVHGAGGTLLQHLKEHRLHSSLAPGEGLFYFSTLGWMMWNWLVSGLASGATLLLYDGSPFHPSGNVLFDYAEASGMAVFGTSAKFIDAARKAGLRPRDTHDLSQMRMLASTGSPLAAENFDYVYDAIKPDVHLASISGGTDIVSCFVLGVPTKPVYPGEIQGPGLGMAVDVFDETGRPIRGEKGELVCTRPFPSMPVRFWNDPDGAKYSAAYFERFPGVWAHGDFAEWTEHGGIVIHGRSDATLNPGGVRIGTAEIYAQVEGMPEVLEALAIGQDFENDVRIVLFVRLAEGVKLTDELTAAIKSRIRAGASPRHVPAKIVAVADIPRTKSGKITELAVREVVHGREVKNKEALANPEALELFRDLADLQS